MSLTPQTSHMDQVKASTKAKSLCWPLFVTKSLQQFIRTQPPRKDPKERAKRAAGRCAMEAASKGGRYGGTSASHNTGSVTLFLCKTRAKLE